MTQLEREGYIAQPHTSAGRIPTDQGYRYYVDHFTKAGALPVSPAPGRRRLLRLRPQRAGGPAPRDEPAARPAHQPRRRRRRPAVRRRSGPQRPARRARSPSSCSRSWCCRTASVEKEVVSNAGDVDRGAGRPGQRRARRRRSREQSSAAAPVARSHRRPRRRRARRLGVEALVAGARRPAPSRSTSVARAGSRRAGRVRHRRARVAAARDARAAGRGRRRSCASCSTRASPCSIGSENDVDELRDCSLVLAPYRVDGQMAGTVGVLGPTRMDYQQAQAAVAAVSQQLGRLLLG